MIATIVLAALAGFAATPERAFARSVYTKSGARLVIARTNVVGNFATVLARNGMMEGRPTTAPILFERFGFGWQALESLDFRCRLDTHGISSGAKVALMRGMPMPSVEAACDTFGGTDVGPASDIEALRRVSHEPLVPSLAVAENYALVSWYGGGGGEKLYRKRAGTWRFVKGGGGPLDAGIMESLGVPSKLWCTMRVFRATCPAAPETKKRSATP